MNENISVEKYELSKKGRITAVVTSLLSSAVQHRRQRRSVFRMLKKSVEQIESCSAHIFFALILRLFFRFFDI